MLRLSTKSLDRRISRRKKQGCVFIIRSIVPFYIDIDSQSANDVGYLAQKISLLKIANLMP